MLLLEKVRLNCDLCSHPVPSFPICFCTVRTSLPATYISSFPNDAK